MQRNWYFSATSDLYEGAHRREKSFETLGVDGVTCPGWPLSVSALAFNNAWCIESDICLSEKLTWYCEEYRFNSWKVHTCTYVCTTHYWMSAKTLSVTNVGSTTRFRIFMNISWVDELLYIPRTAAVYEVFHCNFNDNWFENYYESKEHLCMCNVMKSLSFWWHPRSPWALQLRK